MYETAPFFLYNPIKTATHSYWYFFTFFTVLFIHMTMHTLQTLCILMFFSLNDSFLNQQQWLLLVLNALKLYPKGVIFEPEKERGCYREAPVDQGCLEMKVYGDVHFQHTVTILACFLTLVTC